MVKTLTVPIDEINWDVLRWSGMKMRSRTSGGRGKARAREIVGKVDDDLSGNPLAPGKPLKGIFRGFFRYRHGDYRVIHFIDRREEKNC
ncbi:MAG: hypothetical protein HPY67_12905 [Syntrophaceae bacterium]|nr:hypothetical protein [Syntrophaceae bacterium]